MKIIVEVQTMDGLRYYRVQIPDNCKLTWQGANPAQKQGHHGEGNCLRIYESQKQIMVIPNVLTWRREDIIVEEFVQPRDVIGKAWIDQKDGPLFSQEEREIELPPRGDEDWGEAEAPPQISGAMGAFGGQVPGRIAFKRKRAS